LIGFEAQDLIDGVWGGKGNGGLSKVRAIRTGRETGRYVESQGKESSTREEERGTRAGKGESEQGAQVVR